MKKKSFKITLSTLMVLFIAALLVIKVFDIKRYQTPEKVIAWDVISYYAYLPGTFIEHDYTLSFVGTDTAYYRHYWPEVTSDGHYVIKTTMGLSLLYSPFFFVAHALAAPLGYPADGYSAPYALALILACVFWVVLGCVFLRKVLQQRFSELTTSTVLLVTVVATNLYWYCTYEAAYPHGFLFGLICIFLYQTEKWHKKPSWWGTLAIGLNMGLISLIRPSDALVLVYFLLYDITSWKSILEKVSLYLRHLPMVLVMAASAVAIWIPQLLYWHSLTGSWFYYSYSADERFFWGQPKLLQGILGFRKGWLIYTPTMLFALIGLIPLYKKHRSYFYATVVFLIATLYVILSWWCWWYGGCFGQRSMVDCYGLLAVPMAAFVEWMLRRKWPLRIALIVLFVAISYLSYFHFRQYRYGAIHYDSMTRKAYFDSFGHRRPSDRFNDLLDTPDYEAAKIGKR